MYCNLMHEEYQYVRSFLIMNVIIILFRTGTFGSVFEYGCERQISDHSRLAATMSIGVPVGVILKVK